MFEQIVHASRVREWGRRRSKHTAPSLQPRQQNAVARDGIISSVRCKPFSRLFRPDL
jgi:hypothetical protein